MSRIHAAHPFQWIIEIVEDHPTFVRKRMFGCEAIYLHGHLALVLAASEEPWNGLLVCTSQESHESLILEYPVLRSHPILGKWLYVSQTVGEFEDVAHRIAGRATRGDPRIGVESKPRRQRRGRKIEKR